MHNQLQSTYKELPHIIGFDGSQFRYMQVAPHSLRDLIPTTKLHARRDFKRAFSGKVPSLTYGTPLDLTQSFLTPTGEITWHTWAFASAEGRPAYEHALLGLPINPNTVGASVRIARLAHEARFAEYAQSLEQQARNRMPLYLIAQGPNEMRFGSACILPVGVAQVGERYPIVESGLLVHEGPSFESAEECLTGKYHKVNGSTQGIPYVRVRVPKADIIELHRPNRTQIRVA